ncbi:hypothetical protein DY000_02013728 [Brassica cretica]|uniref:Uncharacterized protein n=1 Tax=Brassica cretica TaxID=69181 RepID=A0ABQ7CSZ8_BRACR|nr:hypothetical protein DY000_02013728 [Brassica cretica]
MQATLRFFDGSSSPPPEYSPLHIESLSASADDEGENFPPKEPRYEASREIFQARTHEFPHMMRPTRTPVTARYISMGAMERYNTLKRRKFINQQRLSFPEETLLEGENVSSRKSSRKWSKTMWNRGMCYTC